MDVVCERCQTEYEFDDALVSERGTTVKCTNCGHQFKIYRPASSGGASEAGSWSLRRPDGTTITFDSLAVLQKWIIEGRVTRADQISRNGEAWKPLGSIAELESFFATAELRGGGLRGGTVTGVGSGRRPASLPPPLPPGRSQRPPPPPPTAAAAPPPPPPPTTAGSGTLRPGAAPPTSAVPSSAGLPAIPAPPRVPAATNGAATASPGFSMGSATKTASEGEGFDFGEDTGIVERWGDKGKPGARPPVAPPPATTVAARRPSGQPAGSRSDEPPPPGRRRIPAESADEAVTTSRDADSLELPAPARKRASGALIGAIAGVALTLGGVGLAWRFGAFGGAGVAPTQSAPQDHVAEVVARTSDAARTATRGALDESAGELTALLANDPNEPRLRAARAESLALLGEQTRQHAEDLEARAAQGGGPDAATQRAEAALNRRDVSTTLERASQDVSVAETGSGRVSTPTDRVRYNTALGEASRVLGDMSAAHRHLDHARAAGGGPEADLLAALLARDEGNADGAIEQLRAAAGHPETAVRAHLALGRLLASRGDAAGARAEADAVTREIPTHEEAQGLAQAVAAGQPPFHGTGAVAARADAGATTAPAVATGHTDAGTTVASAGSAPAAAGDGGAGGGGSSGAGGGGGFAGRSYDSLVAEGDRLQEHGQRERARAAYNSALAQRPDGSEAITGLGWVELDGGSASVAVSHFRRALTMNPRFSDAYIGLGEAYSSLNDLSQALQAYRSYLSINPDGSRARMAQNQIDQLQRRMNPGGSTASGGTSGSTGSGSSGSGSSGSPPSGESGSPTTGGSGGSTTGGGTGGGATGGGEAPPSSGGGSSAGAPSAPGGGT